MKITIIEKPLNLKKVHTVKSWIAAVRLFNKKVKESPNKNFIMTSEKGDYKDTLGFTNE